jgi:hypothetical protein
LRVLGILIAGVLVFCVLVISVAGTRSPRSPKSPKSSRAVSAVVGFYAGYRLWGYGSQG